MASVDSHSTTDEKTDHQNGSIATLNPDRFGFTGGQQYTDPNLETRLPIEIHIQRENKWLEMLSGWEKQMNKDFKKVKERCRKGIPPSIRARAWQHLCGSVYVMQRNPRKYQQYCSTESSTTSRCVDEIKRDLDRQFPFHELFAAKGGQGQKDLFFVLKAWAIRRPEVGYCQAQAPIAAVLLMHMPAEQAFWCFAQICEKYLHGYFSPGLEAVKLDGDILFGLLRKVSRNTYRHFKEQQIEPILYMTEWFMCIFARTLPWPSVLRVWDMFFCEGVKVIFKVALVILCSVLGRKEQLRSCPTMMETLEKLKRIPSEYLEENYLVQQIERLSISDSDMETEHRKVVDRRRRAQQQNPRRNRSR